MSTIFPQPDHAGNGELPKERTPAQSNAFQKEAKLYCRAIRERWVSNEDAKGIVKKMLKFLDREDLAAKDRIAAAKVVMSAAAVDEKMMANALREVQGPGGKTTVVNVIQQVNDYANSLAAAREQRALRRVDGGALPEDGVGEPVAEAQAPSQAGGVPGAG